VSQLVLISLYQRSGGTVELHPLKLYADSIALQEVEYIALIMEKRQLTKQDGPL